MSRYALISVSDKKGIIDFAKSLQQLDFIILSTGGTAKLLRENNIKVIEVADFTGFPEVFDGRVKTLHPKIHGGILNIRTNKDHNMACTELGINNIDIVAVNLYPFEETVLSGASASEIIENIDIGGPAMIRSSAKNHEFVTVVVHSSDYDKVIKEIRTGGDTSINTRKSLAAKAFSHTALYDTMIAGYLNNSLGIMFPEEFSIGGRILQNMRYGENPHQKAAFYKIPLTSSGITGGNQLQGKELSYNNIVDIDAATAIVREFVQPAAVIVKHTNPCGAAAANDIETAYDLALKTDPTSAFGGIVALNRPVDEKLAKKLSEIFLEVIISPSFSSEASDILSKKKNLRLMELNTDDKKFLYELDFKKISGGFLAQEMDTHKFTSLDKLNIPTKRKPTEDEIASMEFAWIIAKHVKSNAIVYAEGTKIVGVGAGQMSRVDSSKIASLKALSPLKGCVMASDAFFPFRDSIDEAAAQGITAIISPGGSIRDAEVIQAADEHNIAMIFTGIRHFKH